MLEKIGGRKVALGLLLVAVGVAIEFVSPKGLTETMSTYLLGMGLGYFLANGVVHAAREAKDAVVAKAQKSEAQALDVTPALDELKAQLEEVKTALGQQTQPAGAKEMVEVKTALTAVVNQNAVISQTIGEVGKAVTYLVEAVQGRK